MNREFLDVPYSEKDEAKRAGARWDPVAKKWYAPRPGMNALERWKARPPVPSVLVGEDRSYGSGLYVDLIPKSCWFTNVRSSVSEVDWKRIRRMVIDRAGKRCEICGSDKYLEAHERFYFDEVTQTQRLRRLICVCRQCHNATHYGLAQIMGSDQEAIRHLMKVNGWSGSDVSVHVRQAIDVWRQRSQLEWHLDLSILEYANIRITTSSAPRQRKIQTGPITKSLLQANRILPQLHRRRNRGLEINF